VIQVSQVVICDIDGGNLFFLTMVVYADQLQAYVLCGTCNGVR